MLSQATLDALYEEAFKDAISSLEATGSPVISGGEQTKSSFVTYPLVNISNNAANGVIIAFEDDHAGSCQN